MPVDFAAQLMSPKGLPRFLEQATFFPGHVQDSRRQSAHLNAQKELFAGTAGIQWNQDYEDILTYKLKPEQSSTIAYN